MTPTEFRPTFVRLLAAATLAASLAGCVDETRVREMTDNLIRAREAAFFTRRAQHAREPATAKECCDDLMTPQLVALLPARIGSIAVSMD